MRSLRLSLSLLGFLAVALLAAPVASADPDWRVEARVAFDGAWTVSGEKVIDDPLNPPADTTGTIEIWRSGAKIAEATGQPDPAGLALLGSTAAPDGVALEAGDELRYRNGAALATATYDGNPAVGADACTGRASFGAAHTNALVATGGAVGVGDPNDGTATIDSVSGLTVSLARGLDEGSVAWVFTARELAAGTVAFGTRGERLVGTCAAPTLTGGTLPGATGDFGNGGAASLPAPTPIVPAPPAVLPAPPDRRPPLLTLDVPKMKLRDVAKYGFAFATSCGEPCVVGATIGVDARTAKALKSKAVLGQGQVPLTSGRGAVPIKLAKAVRSRIGRLRRLNLVVAVRATDAAGNVATATKNITLRR